MSFVHENNIATASTSEGSQSGNAEFNVANDLEVKVTKTVDRATTDDPTPLYYNGDTIIFTITLERTSGMGGAINQITLTDQFSNEVLIANTSAVQIVLGVAGPITLTGGNINGTGKLLTIGNLVLNNGNPKIIVTITGTIVYP